MTDPDIKKILLSKNFTPFDIEYICPSNASEGYKSFIKYITNSLGNEIILPSREDFDLHIQEIEYLIKSAKTVLKNKRIAFTNFCFSIDVLAKAPLLSHLLEVTSIAYVLILEWSIYGNESSNNTSRIFSNLEHHFQKHLCQFLLEDLTDVQCQNVAESLATFASPDTFRIIYEAKELDLNYCLYQAAIVENLPLVQLLVRDPLV